MYDVGHHHKEYPLSAHLTHTLHTLKPSRMTSTHKHPHTQHNKSYMSCIRAITLVEVGCAWESWNIHAILKDYRDRYKYALWRMCVREFVLRWQFTHTHKDMKGGLEVCSCIHRVSSKES